MAKLTVKKIETLPAGTHTDGEGLQLKVSGKSSKLWQFRYQLEGKREVIGLGSYPEITLSRARQLAAEQRTLLAEGINPKAHRAAQEAHRAAQEAKQAEKAYTFKQAAADYIEAHRSGWTNAKHAQQWENTLAAYAHPKIGKKAVGEITTDDVLRILKPIWHTKTETANRVRNRIELILDSAKARGKREGENPARWRGHLDKLLPPRARVQKRENFPAMPYTEVAAFISEVEALEYSSSRQALLLLIHTATRTSEVLNSTWEEFDLPNRLWIIPDTRMKAKREHRVPLTDEALTIIENTHPIAGNPHVFAGARAGRPLSNMALLQLMRGMGFGHDGSRGAYVPHGFRSSFRDWAGECTHHPRDVCEQALAHTLGNAVEAAYRRGDLLQKRAALMRDWSKFITTKVSANVVPIRGAI